MGFASFRSKDGYKVAVNTSKVASIGEMPGVEKHTMITFEFDGSIAVREGFDRVLAALNGKQD